MQIDIGIDEKARKDIADGLSHLLGEQCGAGRLKGILSKAFQQPVSEAFLFLAESNGRTRQRDISRANVNDPPLLEFVQHKLHDLGGCVGQESLPQFLAGHTGGQRMTGMVAVESQTELLRQSIDHRQVDDEGRFLRDDADALHVAKQLEDHGLLQSRCGNQVFQRNGTHSLAPDSLGQQEPLGLSPTLDEPRQELPVFLEQGRNLSATKPRRVIVEDHSTADGAQR